VQAYLDFYAIDFGQKYTGLAHYFGSVAVAGFEVACHYYRLPKARATCWVMHGYFDHAGLYGHLIDALLARGFSVVIADMPGHGLSTGARASIECFAQYQDWLLGLHQELSPFIEGPLHAVAQSTGGAVVMDYLLNHPRSVFEKVVLLAPLVRPFGWPLYARLIPCLAPFVRSLHRTFSSNSHDENFLHFLKALEPLQHHRLPMPWLKALRVWVRYFKALPACQHALCVIQGEEDSTVDWRFNVPLIEQKFARVELHYLPLARHHLVNEREDIRAVVFERVLAYLEKP
jgi:alpha-beta hydrolase superfamily lysophospholipase